MSDAPLTLGTAGHIDHGKTALIAALTGRDTDRLPEEKQRGISIELGYAPLDLPGGRRLSVVDVPGHERFVRTMVAGATGIDLFLLCVAADDGVMPQTREHVAVLRALGVRMGVVAITKSDLADPARAGEEVAELVPDAERVAVSAVARTGLQELSGALARAAAAAGGRARVDGALRLHIDRSFTLRGIGTVVTGTLWSGAVGAGDRVTVLPRGASVRVRSVQVHDEAVERAAAGQRVALALTGIGWRELHRGDVVTGPGSDLRPTHRLEARVELEPGARPLARGARLQVHHGTRAVPGRVYRLDTDGPIVPGEPALAQLRLEAPLVAVAGDRLVLRRVAPPDTVGGGVVEDPAPSRRSAGGAEDGEEAVGGGGAGRASGRPAAGRAGAGSGLTGSGGAGGAAPEPAAPPLDEAAVRLAAMLRDDGPRPRADGDLAAAAGLSLAEAADALRALERAGLAARTGPNLHFEPESLAALVAQVIALCERDGEATIASVRDALGTSRRYAQAVLEHLDAERLTRRRGDAHVLRRRWS